MVKVDRLKATFIKFGAIYEWDNAMFFLSLASFAGCFSTLATIKVGNKKERAPLGLTHNLCI